MHARACVRACMCAIGRAHLRLDRRQAAAAREQALGTAAGKDGRRITLAHPGGAAQRVQRPAVAAAAGAAAAAAVARRVATGARELGQLSEQAPDARARAGARGVAVAHVELAGAEVGAAVAVVEDGVGGRAGGAKDTEGARVGRARL